ncbi:DUF1254 domain-containing protein [Paludisphaera rhizosphaerae]|uniref:DUF1254 domain-containing protein n=1 Tax=Paludisphaera rhizosphaerae TaxID=2711216 RepID=UPI00197D64F6|nr:DUF1254 domain-containing protein [Paludisphaera rhizosphaerae]
MRSCTRTTAIEVACRPLLILATALSISPSGAVADEPVGEEEAREIAREAYVYFYPLVTMDVTRRQGTDVEAGPSPGRGPMNSFSHLRSFPDANYREVVRPNFDTLYSSAWLDLTAGPVVVSTPDTGGRYYLLPMLDMWSDVFAVPGKRTTGTGAGRLAVVPPGWRGEVPEGTERIDAPTPYVWIIGRTQTNGPQDYEAVHKIQDGFTITPAASQGPTRRPITAEAIPALAPKKPPLQQVNGMPGSAYFRYAAELMKLHPPHVTDQPIVARMRRLGLKAGESFDPERLAPAVRKALDEAPAAGLAHMNAKLPTLARVVDGWQMNTDTMGVYGTYYLKRAILAMVGLGANLPEDAIYPLCIVDAGGRPLDGANRYVLHFPKDALPPVDAFWSLTMYDAEGFQAANSLNRFAIGDRDKLTYNADGSLDLFIQHENPGTDKTANWLPAPTGPLGLTMRLYGPKPQALDGRWHPPAVKRVD